MPSKGFRVLLKALEPLLTRLLIFNKFNGAPSSKSPTRQSCYGDGALWGILAKANKRRLNNGKISYDLEFKLGTYSR